MIVGYLLKHIKDKAEQYLKTTITDAVISIPVLSNNNQRIATKNAGFYAGFEFTRLYSEPSAIALSYVYDLDSSI
jgi:molecular chaperone DnaK (HSP70)